MDGITIYTPTPACGHVTQIAAAVDSHYSLAHLRRLAERPLVLMLEGEPGPYTPVESDTDSGELDTLATHGLASVAREAIYDPQEPYRPVGFGLVYRVTTLGRDVLREVAREVN